MEGARANEARTIFRGRLATIFAWSCRAHDTGPGGEEATRGNDVVFTRRGSFRRLMRGESIVADPATALFFPRQEPYRVSHPGGAGDDCVVLSFSDEVLEGFESSMKSGAVRVGPRQALRLHRLLATIGGAGRRQDEMPALEIEEMTLDLAGGLLRGASAGPLDRRGAARGRIPARRRDSSWRRPGTSRRHRRIIERVQLLLAARYDERLTLEAIAREAASSPYYLCRLFREGTGSTIHRHLNRLRLLRALEMLEPGVDLARVALDVGFSSHSHFSSAFHREFGLAPSSVARGAERFATRRIRKILKAFVRTRA